MRNTRYSNYFRFIAFGIDIVIIIGFFILFLKINTYESSYIGFIQLLKAHYKAFFIFIFSWVFISSYTSLYKSYRFSGFVELFRRVLIQIFLFSILVFAVSGIKREDFFSIKETFNYLFLLFISLNAYRLSFHFLIRKYRSMGYNERYILFVGMNENTPNLVEMFSRNKRLGFKSHGFFVKKTNRNNKQEMLYSLESVQAFLSSNPVHFIYISLNGDLNNQDIKQLIELAQKKYIEIHFIPDSLNNMQSNLRVEYVDTFQIFKFTKFPLDKAFNQITKRLFDIVFSLIVILLIFSWLFPIIIIFIILDSGFPIFFLQKRNGLNGSIFNCFKFRTMKPNKDSNSKPTERNDPRVTRLGKLLRKTSIDELPQFINVLMGQMSVVGPRPHMISENERYDSIINQYALRHYVKPGITGLAQIRGYRGKIETNRDMLLRVKSDVFYIKRWSFTLDVFIILKTIWNVVKGDKNAF